MNFRAYLAFQQAASKEFNPNFDSFIPHILAGCLDLGFRNAEFGFGFGLRQIRNRKTQPLYAPLPKN